MTKGVPVLCYHRVHAQHDCPPTPPRGEYCGHVTLNDFRDQMGYLAEKGFRTITYPELTAWLRTGRAIPDRSVAIDFDDNRLNVAQNALPVMKQFGFVGTVFIITQLAAGADLGSMSALYPAMAWEELKALRSEGWLLANHTRTHPLLGELFSEPDGGRKCVREIEEAREEMDAALDQKTEHFAYPVGSWNQDVETIVQQNHKSARHWDTSAAPVYVTRETSPYRVPAINISAHVSFAEFRTIIDTAIT